MIVRDGLMSWKRTLRVLTQAKQRGWETVVAVDTRSVDGTRAAVAPLTDILIDYTPQTETCADGIDSTVRASTKKFVLLNSDDEEPSPDLWKFCERPFMEACYGVYMLSPVPDGRLYTPGTEWQLRLVVPRIWKWVGGFDGTDEVLANKRVQLNMILWHFACYAPREFREEKMRRYQAIGATEEYGVRHYFEDHPDKFRDMDARERSQFPG